MNEDGKIGILDIIKLNKAIAGLVDLSDQAKANADCYMDQKIDANDIQALMKYIVGLVASIPYVD